MLCARGEVVWCRVVDVLLLNIAYHPRNCNIILIALLMLMTMQRVRCMYAS